jgi:geranylgeranyl pyrophosphate synthase
MTESLKTYQRRVEQALDRCLTKPHVPQDLQAAMRYSVFNGGKRIRPSLVYLATTALGQPLDLADSSACAIELIHSYSLIHDDLPAMDDDDLRRGKPTCHIQFGEATAVLAGDALQALAFEVLAEDQVLPPGIRIDLVRAIATAAGGSGMVGGQAIDLACEQLDIDAVTLENMHRRKTGDLISCSVVCGALIADADLQIRNALTEFGYAIGLAFQIKDDILDETGDTLVIGKQVGSDRERQKSTFVSVHGLSGAQAQLEALRLTCAGWPILSPVAIVSRRC